MVRDITEILLVFLTIWALLICVPIFIRDPCIKLLIIPTSKRCDTCKHRRWCSRHEKTSLPLGGTSKQTMHSSSRLAFSWTWNFILNEWRFWYSSEKNYYCKQVETFHNVSECKTVLYFSWWFTLQPRWPGDLDR